MRLSTRLRSTYAALSSRRLLTTVVGTGMTGFMPSARSGSRIFSLSHPFRQWLSPADSLTARRRVTRRRRNFMALSGCQHDSDRRRFVRGGKVQLSGESAPISVEPLALLPPSSCEPRPHENKLTRSSCHTTTGGRRRNRPGRSRKPLAHNRPSPTAESVDTPHSGRRTLGKIPPWNSRSRNVEKRRRRSHDRTNQAATLLGVSPHTSLWKPGPTSVGNLHSCAVHGDLHLKITHREQTSKNS